MHPLYFLLWAWIVMIFGIALIALCEVALKKFHLWSDSGLQSVGFLVLLSLTFVAFIVLGSHGLIMWCAAEPSIARIVVAVSIGLISLPGAFALYLLLQLGIPPLFGEDAALGRNLP